MHHVIPFYIAVQFKQKLHLNIAGIIMSILLLLLLLLLILFKPFHTRSVISLFHLFSERNDMVCKSRLNWKTLPSDLKNFERILKESTMLIISHEDIFFNIIESFTLPALHVKIYCQKYTSSRERQQVKHLGFKTTNTSETLYNASNWFWIHNEYEAGNYMLKRAQHDGRLFTENMEEADLCFPHCNSDNNNNGLTTRQQQTVTLEVRTQSKSKFAWCNQITLGIETPLTKCTFPVPYWHSIYLPDNNNNSLANSPWNIMAQRHNILCFTGGSWRGYARDRVIAEMKTISESFNSFTTEGQKLFAVDFVFPSQKEESDVWGAERFFSRVWELYARSIFSWQPEGDSETRRGFYDSWMLGCIPVISQTSANTYKNLFRGHLFNTGIIGPPIQSVVVVLDDDIMQSGAAILESLAAISSTEIKIRQRWLKRLAPLMQWGWDNSSSSSKHPDALLMALAAVMT